MVGASSDNGGEDYVLLVEDEPILRDNWSYLIQRKTGYRVLAFPFAIEAADYLLNTQQYPVALFCDMRISGELHGPARLYYYLASVGQTTNFYFITAHLSMHDREVVKRSGARVLVGKSLDEIVDIVLAIREVAGLPKPQPEPELDSNI